MNHKLWPLFIAGPHGRLGEHAIHKAASGERQAMSAVENVAYPQGLWQ
jgi:hypothetical protein